MNHDARIAVATDVTRRLLREHGAQLLYVGAYGSLLDQTDRGHSDIDLFVVLKNEVAGASSWIGCCLADAVVGLGLYSIEDVDRAVSSPNFRWPYVVGKFVHNRPLYCRTDIAARSRALISDLSQDTFVRAARVEYLEAFSGFRGIADRRAATVDIGDLRSQSLKGLRRLEACVALVNRGFLHGETSRKNILLIRAFRESLAGYVTLSRRVWRSDDKKEMQDAMESLWGSATRFGTRHKLLPDRYSSVEDMALR